MRVKPSTAATEIEDCETKFRTKRRMTLVTARIDTMRGGREVLTPVGDDFLRNVYYMRPKSRIFLQMTIVLLIFAFAKLGLGSAGNLGTAKIGIEEEI